MITISRPDMLITADGKHLAIIEDGENIALLRSRAGEYVRDVFGETAGIKREPVSIEEHETARCSEDSCVIDVHRKRKSWTVLATRTPNLIPAMQLAAACRRADIVVSDRYLPRSCQPRWLKLDRKELNQRGGVALYLEKGRIDSVNERLQGAPWYNLNPR